MALSSARSTTFFRSGGILLHPTSLPGRHGIGDVREMYSNDIRFIEQF